MIMTNRYIRMMALTVLMLCQPTAMQAQKWSVKTNLLSDALTVPSVSSEHRISLRWTACLDVEWMPFYQSSDRYLRTFKLQPEAHYWFRAPFTGPFVGPAFSWRLFNIGDLPVFHTSGGRAQGFMIGGGITAGWHFTLSNRWGLEPTVTLGYAYVSNKRYDVPRSRAPLDRWKGNYVGPLSGALHLVYMLK